MKIINLKTSFSLLMLVMAAALLMQGCKKDDGATGTVPIDGSTISFVLNDNFNFAGAYASLQKVNMVDTLAQKGPFTFFAPDNNAYNGINVREPFPQAAFYDFTGTRMRDCMRYYTLNQRVSLKQLPLVQNKAYVTRTGGNIYITKYLNGKDTVITVNGIKLINGDNAASNGNIQVISQFLNPEIYHQAAAYIHADTAITMFAAAMQRSGLEASLLKGTDTYTLIAPSNVAFQKSRQLGKNLGISTLDSILTADPAKLAQILKYHIIKGMNFEGDLYRMGTAQPNGIETLSGGKVKIGGSAGTFLGQKFRGAGNQTDAGYTIDYSHASNIPANRPCGNAVVHIVNQVLIP